MLSNYSHRMTMIQGNSRISERNFSEDPVLMVYQKQEAFNQTKNSVQWTFESKLSGQMCILSDILKLIMLLRWMKRCCKGGKDSIVKYFCYCCLFCFVLYLIFLIFLGGYITGMMCRYEGLGWVGLGHIMWNSHRINKKFGVFFGLFCFKKVQEQ